MQRKSTHVFERNDNIVDTKKTDKRELAGTAGGKT